ncbi:MAG: gliding motility lipoprotein GldH [Flavobacteriaceae bacterium]|nr:gliding motility lipoprotein GldH [Bacteroidia bacterium]NNF75231.1 gliding motility lipoprotein GldH [Flavobacteriaceae bacterium]NNK73841.1 gliding motility lipoprotein GldH [Flavobacteriaceae bacterium]
MRGSRSVLIGLCLIIIGCDSSQVYDEYQSLNSSWDKDELVEFKITPPDTTGAYDLFVNLRNTSDYKYSNIFIIVEMNHPNGKVLKDTLEYRMTTAEGEFLGSGFSDIKENKLWYKEGYVFKESGEYIVKISQAMRENRSVNGVEKLDGIIDVGFRIERPKVSN